MFDISVCISVHNTAEFLPRALDSILAMKTISLEIVLVNNGSTDNSEEIMRSYQSRYPNIKIIQQEDKGLAQGRQTGINNATGKYIAFLDADDFVIGNIYEKALHYANDKDLDIVEFCTTRGNKIIRSPFCGVQNTHDVLKEYFWGKKTIYPMMWLRIYKRELFKKTVLPKIYVNNEDIFAYPCLLYCAKSIGFIPDIGHNYSLDNSSAVMIQLRKEKQYSKKFYENRKKTLLCIEHIKNYIGEDNIKSELFDEFEQYKQRVMVTYLLSDIYTVSLKKLKEDLVKQFGFRNIRDLMNFIKKHTKNDSDVNKIIHTFGFHIAYIIHKIRKMMH